MNIAAVRTISFSPTGTSKAVVTAIGEGFAGVAEQVGTDLTCPGFSAGAPIGENDLAVIGVPVYAGRVPALAVERLQTIEGNGAPAVIVVVYGNREFEDALLELQEIAAARGFRVVAGAAFIGEHSFSTAELPIAEGRPDKEDLDKAREFGRTLAAALAGYLKGGAVKLDIPGNIPYKEGMTNLPFAPVVDHEACTRCGICVEKCPAGALSLKAEIVTDVDSCILCASCIKVCPEQAVSLKSTPMAEKMAALHEHCSVRKEPQLFMQS